MNFLYAILYSFLPCHSLYFVVVASTVIMFTLLSPHKFKNTNELYIFSLSLSHFVFGGLLLPLCFCNVMLSLAAVTSIVDAIRRFMFYIHPVESEFVDYLCYSKFGSIGLCGAYDATHKNTNTHVHTPIYNRTYLLKVHRKPAMMQNYRQNAYQE